MTMSIFNRDVWKLKYKQKSCGFMNICRRTKLKLFINKLQILKAESKLQTSLKKKKPLKWKIRIKAKIEAVSSFLLSPFNISLLCFCFCRDHAALADFFRLLLRFPVPVHLVVPLPDLQHAHLQLHVRPHGYLQCRPPGSPLPVPVPVLSGVHPAWGQLHQVRHEEPFDAFVVSPYLLHHLNSDKYFL